MTDQEKNEEIARKLGYSVGKIKSTKEIVINRDGKTPKFMKCDDIERLPDYLNDIRVAWEILTDHCEEWTIQCPGPFVHVDLQTKDYSRESAQADTAPRAICEAFLKLP